MTALLDRTPTANLTRQTGIVPSGASTESRWSRSSVIAVFAAALAAIGLIIVNVASIWTNSDTSWTWLLPGQLMNGAPRAVSLVDGNRLFPDLLLSAAVRALTSIFGLALTGQYFVVLYDLLVVGLVIIAIVKIHGRSTAALAGVMLLLVLLAADPSTIESIRPGYHALSAALCLLLVARRFRRYGCSYDVLELLLLAMLIASSRFLLTVVLVPLIATDVVLRNIRAHRSWRLLIPGLAGLFGWAALNDVPNVEVIYAPTTIQRGGTITWLWDYAKSMADAPFSVVGAAAAPMHGLLIAFLLGLGLLVVVTRRFSTLSKPDRFLITLTTASTIIGGVTLRAGGYLVGWRGYIFLFPLLMACVCLPRLVETAMPSASLTAIVVIGAFTTVSFSALNVRAVSQHPQHGAVQEVHQLLVDEGLVDRVGLANYWVGYATQSHYGDMPLYNVDSWVRPFFWVVNPWRLWFDERAGRLDMHRRIDYVISSRSCDSVAPCDPEGLTPKRSEIVAVLGEPDRWVRTSQFRLAIYNQGANSAKLLALWKHRMDLAHLPYPATIGG